MLIAIPLTALLIGAAAVLIYFIRSSHELQNQREIRKHDLELRKPQIDPFQVDVAKINQEGETERHRMSIVAKEAYMEDEVSVAKYEYWARQSELAKEALINFESFRVAYPNIDGEEFVKILRDQLSPEPPLGRSFEKPTV